MDRQVIFDPELIRRYDTSGPRYTSYPTAVQFSDRFGPADHADFARLAVQGNPALSLYVHIPFCATVCFYCGCNKIVTRDRERAAPYLDSSFRGEAVLSVGKALDMISRGAAGIVNAMPFGCMPGTVVTSMLRAISAQYGVPCISIPFDGTPQPTINLMLEAFMDQAKAGRG